MPTYSYGCGECSHEFDIVLKIADRDVPVSEPCPNCGKPTVSKLVGAAATVYTLSPTSVSKQGRVPDGFKEVLQKIHEKTPGSQLNKTSPYVK